MSARRRAALRRGAQPQNARASLSERQPYIIHGSYVEEALPNMMRLIQGGLKTFRGDLQTIYGK